MVFRLWEQPTPEVWSGMTWCLEMQLHIQHPKQSPHLSSSGEKMDGIFLIYWKWTVRCMPIFLEALLVLLGFLEMAFLKLPWLWWGQVLFQLYELWILGTYPMRHRRSIWGDSFTVCVCEAGGRLLEDLWDGLLFFCFWQWGHQHNIRPSCAAYLGISSS